MRGLWPVVVIGICVSVGGSLARVAPTAGSDPASAAQVRRTCVWCTVPSADPVPRLYDWFNSVTAVSPNDAWAVGDYFTNQEVGRFGAFIERWNGRRWQLAHPTTVTNRSPTYGPSPRSP